MDLRPLTNADRDALIDLHAASFRVTYVSVFSAAYIQHDLHRDIAKVWENWPDTKLVLGAFDDKNLIGFATYLMDQTPCYIDNFHVATAHHGKGVAQFLFTHGAAHVATLGATSLKLTVLETNARARAFYTRLGGQEGAPIQDEMLDHKVTAIPVHWSDLTQLQKKTSLSSEALDGRVD